MYNFFVNQKDKDCFFITGPDYNHIKNVLRMKTGDELLVSCEGKSSLCFIDSFTSDTVIAKISEENYQDTSLPIKVFLLQGLPKSEKMELIIQKAVELGAEGVVPVEMHRSVVKLDEKKKKQKRDRWQEIALSAAKQSKRSVVPTVYDVMPYKEALSALKLDVLLVPYENEKGMFSTKEAFLQIKRGMSVGILIGPEGGFEESEVEKALSAGGKIISLGKRILRTETAAITALSMCMIYAEMALNGEE